jgi:hypothetical protein
LNKYYFISFSTAGGKTRSIRVTRADLTLSDGDVTTQVNKMIASGVLLNDSGPVTGIKKVDKVTETVATIIG